MGHRAGKEAWTDLEAHSLGQRVPTAAPTPASSFSVLLYTPGNPFPFEPHHPGSLALWVPVGFGQWEAPAGRRWVDRDVGVFLPALSQPRPLGSDRGCFSQNNGPPLTHRQERCLISLPLQPEVRGLPAGAGPWGLRDPCRFPQPHPYLGKKPIRSPQLNQLRKLALLLGP